MLSTTSSSSSSSLICDISISVIVLIFSTAICSTDPSKYVEEPLVMSLQDQVAMEYKNHLYFMEVVTSISLLVVLVWLLNREFEISYRLSYHCSRLSARDRRKIQNLKNQADWLLHNIIPRYVHHSVELSESQCGNYRNLLSRPKFFREIKNMNFIFIF